MTRHLHAVQTFAIYAALSFPCTVSIAANGFETKVIDTWSACYSDAGHMLSSAEVGERKSPLENEYMATLIDGHRAAATKDGVVIAIHHTLHNQKTADIDKFWRITIGTNNGNLGKEVDLSAGSVFYSDGSLVWLHKGSGVSASKMSGTLNIQRVADQGLMLTLNARLTAKLAKPFTGVPGEEKIELQGKVLAKKCSLEEFNGLPPVFGKM